MASFSDMVKDIEQEQFLERWAPKESFEHLKPTMENLRWNIARANAAEAELTELKIALRIFKQQLERV